MSKQVEKTYSCIARHFDETRVAYWKGVREVLLGLASGSVVLDCGCGNGKYSRLREDLCFLSFDFTSALVEIAATSGQSVGGYFLGSVVRVPVRDKCVDCAICVAVLHHVLEARVALLEILRCSREKAVVTLWAEEQEKKKKWVQVGETDYLVPWLDKYTGETVMRWYRLYTREMVEALCSGLEGEWSYRIEYERCNWVIFLTRV